MRNTCAPCVADSATHMISLFYCQSLAFTPHALTAVASPRAAVRLQALDPSAVEVAAEAAKDPSVVASLDPNVLAVIGGAGLVGAALALQNGAESDAQVQLPSKNPKKVQNLKSDGLQVVMRREKVQSQLAEKSLRLKDLLMESSPATPTTEGTTGAGEVPRVRKRDRLRKWLSGLGGSLLKKDGTKAAQKPLDEALEEALDETVNVALATDEAELALAEVAAEVAAKMDPPKYDALETVLNQVEWPSRKASAPPDAKPLAVDEAAPVDESAFYNPGRAKAVAAAKAEAQARREQKAARVRAESEARLVAAKAAAKERAAAIVAAKAKAEALRAEKAAKEKEAAEKKAAKEAAEKAKIDAAFRAAGEARAARAAAAKAAEGEGKTGKSE